MVLLFILFFLHWFADFLTQPNYVATNKSKSIKILAVHCLMYTAPFFILFPAFVTVVGWLGFMTKLLWLFLSHFAIDFVTSRVNAKLWAAKEVHYFFVSIGLDQFAHYIVLCLLFFN